MATWRIAVVGAGGIGGSIAGYLIKGGYDVTIIDQWAAHIEAIRTRGLQVTDINGTFSVPAPALHVSDVSNLREPFDVVFISVKSYDIVWTTHLIRPCLKPGGFVLPAMNGLNDECVAQIVGYPRTVGCVTTIGAGVYEPGHVVRTDPLTRHAFTVGELNGLITPRVRRIVEALQCVGPSSPTTNIWGARWAKMIWNCMGNALAGILGDAAASMTDTQSETKKLVRVVTGIETARVANALGVTLEPVIGIPADRFLTAKHREDILALQAELHSIQEARQLDPARRRHLPQRGRPSLLQDVLKGRRTEVQQLNGEVVRLGQQLGLATPMNAALVDFVERISTGEIQPGLDHLAQLGALAEELLEAGL